MTHTTSGPPVPLRPRAYCAKLVALSDHMEHSSRGDLQLLYPVVSSKLPVMSSACRNCPRSAIQAQKEVLDPCCEPYAQPSPSLAFFTGSKKAWDWMSNGSLQSYSLAAFSCRGGQSVITHFCVDKLSELQISLVGELTSAITLILMRRAANSHSVETSQTDSGHRRVAE